MLNKLVRMRVEISRKSNTTKALEDSFRLGVGKLFFPAFSSMERQKGRELSAPNVESKVRKLNFPPPQVEKEKRFGYEADGGAKFCVLFLLLNPSTRRNPAVRCVNLIPYLHLEAKGLFYSFALRSLSGSIHEEWHGEWWKCASVRVDNFT